MVFQFTQFNFRIQYLFKPKPGFVHPGHSFYRALFPKIIQDIDSIENNWRMGRHNLQVINSILKINFSLDANKFYAINFVVLTENKLS